MMAQLFRGRADVDTGPRLERELQSLEEQAREASAGYETQFLNRAANLCVDAGQPARALGYFGRAIDAYLESGRFNAAEVLCKKLLQIAPDAVRARCTLAWLSIGKGFRGGPDVEITEYVRAAKKANKSELAIKQLVMMAEATTSAELREILAEHILDLGEDAEADRIFGVVYAERNGLRAPTLADEGKLFADLLQAALMNPQQLNDRPMRPSSPSEDSHSAYLPALTKDEG